MRSLFTRWRDMLIDFEGVTVPLRLRAPLNEFARELRRKCDAWRKEAYTFPERRFAYLSGESGEAPPDEFDMFARAFGEEWGREAFRRAVRLQEPASDDDGNVIAGGAELFDAMGVGERVAVLLKLDGLIYLSASEGKASSSPSTSPAATEAPSASTATSTAPGDGPAR